MKGRGGGGVQKIKRFYGLTWYKLLLNKDWQRKREGGGRRTLQLSN